VVDREVGYLLTEMETALTDGERSRELIEEFARLHPQNPRSGPPWE